MVNAVGHILELTRGGQIGVMEYLPFQDIGVEGGNAVDILAGTDAQVGHAHLAPPDDGHVGDLALVAAVAPLQLPLVAVGDLLQDLPHTGEQALNQGLGPPLQSFGQDGMVGVAHGMGDNMPCLVPGIALLVQQDAH